MSSHEGEGDASSEDVGYKPPEKRTLSEIQALDAEDESLRRYKAALLGEVGDAPFPDNPATFIPEGFSICVDGQPNVSFSFHGDLNNFKSTPVSIPEGSNYHIEIQFYVQRDIVTGLKYEQSTYRGPLRLDHSDVMMGSFAPRKEPHNWISETYEAPKGKVHRGTYSVKSRFHDVDRTDFLSWKWQITVVKSANSAD
jgi:Rho GDP-dissociation inhibitor